MVKFDTYRWIPAFAGMTKYSNFKLIHLHSEIYVKIKNITMNSENIVRNFIEIVLNKADFDAIDQYIDPHFQTHSLHHNPTPMGSMGTHPPSFKEALIHSQKILANFNRAIDDLIVEGDKVVVRYTTTVTQVGEFMGFAPTNKEVSFTGVSIYRIVGGKIVEEWYVWDRLGLHDQLKELGAVTV